MAANGGQCWLWFCILEEEINAESSLKWLLHSHVHTHNCTMNFTSNIEEVMALWAISLSISAVEVPSRCFESLIIRQKSHGRHTDRRSSGKHTASDSIPDESCAGHVPITDPDNGICTSEGD